MSAIDPASVNLINKDTNKLTDQELRQQFKAATTLYLALQRYREHIPLDDIELAYDFLRDVRKEVELRGLS